MGESTELERRIKARLASGNTLSANDLAASALDTAEDTPRVRYLYLLSLAAAGATQRALAMYPQFAPPAEQCDEDWLALPGRLHKDLAFAGIETTENLRLAATEYRAAHARTGGAFTGINAATLSMLAGEQALGRALATEVLKTLATELPESEIDRYYWHATQAEALLLLDRTREAAAALRAADPLIRNDLTTRSRTRRQIGRIIAQLGQDPALTQVLALPRVYVADFAALAEHRPVLDATLSSRLEGSPLFASAPVTEEAIDLAEYFVDIGVRMQLTLPSTVVRTPRLEYLLKRVEHHSTQLGFLDNEGTWSQCQATRMAHGLARAMAASLGTEVCSLAVGTGDKRWRIEPTVDPEILDAPAGRRMVGLVFADVAGFSRYSDDEVRRYWENAAPGFARAINRFRPRVLLRRTWGDGLHVVTADPEAAAEIGLGLVRVARETRAREHGRLARMEVRVGAHFAPAFEARNRIEESRTYYGSQLSFAARVEPVTPPDTMYVSEPFVAELQMQCPGRFNIEYAGEIALAKRYGTFRMASLQPAKQTAGTLELEFGTAPLTVGVTGHMGLDGAARQRVRRALLPVLQQRLEGVRSVKLICGFAPGSDLVLAETVKQVVDNAHTDLSIQAVLAGDPTEIIAQWCARATELGDPPSASAQVSVEHALRQWMQAADHCERLDLKQPPPENVFQALGAKLAAAPDLLIAAVRGSHAGKAGGSMEVVTWRRDPAQIPESLRAEEPINPSRELILIDPDTGEVVSEGRST